MNGTSAVGYSSSNEACFLNKSEILCNINDNNYISMSKELIILNMKHLPCFDLDSHGIFSRKWYGATFY